MKRAFFLGTVLVVLGSATMAGAVNIGGGVTTGPDNSFSINFTFSNDAGSTSDVTSILLDGSTGSSFPILWDDPGTPGGPPGATVGFAGVDTQLLTISFFDSPDGFNPGESFSLNNVDPDGDPGPASVTIGELEGVEVTFSFEDGSELRGVFVDDPAPGAGLILALLDEDGDGVPDGQDACPETVIPESVPTQGLGVNRFALVDNDTTFDTTAPKGGGNGPGLSFTVEDTAGCSCEQIIDALGLGRGHAKFGCSISATEEWISLVNP
jgi:hypothetical protein